MKKLILIGFLFSLNLGSEIFESDLNLECKVKFNKGNSSGETVAFIKVDKYESWDCYGGRNCHKEGERGD